jgi:hypothetical protein
MDDGWTSAATTTFFYSSALISNWQRNRELVKRCASGLPHVTTSNLLRKIYPHFNLLAQFVVALTQVQGCSGATT